MSNNLDQFSDEELNLVTDYLLKSAKTRFDYKLFKKDLKPLDKDFIDHNILLEIIGSKTIDESNQMISEKILSEFLISGLMVEQDDIDEMVAEKIKELGLEILASKIAMDSLQKGVHPTLVIQQISQLL
jgi:CheY-specific phosphatase CheX